jgi:hypothetical protein
VIRDAARTLNFHWPIGEGQEFHFFFSNSVQFSTNIKGGEDLSSTGTEARMR